jgi:hypothetical protein
MIKLHKNTRVVRETTASFEYMDGEEVKVEQIRVRYFSPTVAEVRSTSSEISAKRKEGETVWLSETLSKQIESLPDLVDDKDKPIKITAEFLETLPVVNLTAINDAIDRDLAPKSTAS